MTPYYSDPWLTIHEGDCRSVMATMEPESVHCVVTSPPYWGLRDYGTATWVGGDEGCDHRKAPIRAPGERLASTLVASEIATRSFKGACGKCGASRIDAQLGLEPTPEAYVANMVAVFREVRRVLRSDGTVWLNLGSSYMATGERTTGRNDAVRQGKQTGGGFEAGPRTSVGGAGASGRSRSPRPERAPACGNDGTGPLGCSAPGCACSDLCDGCLAAPSSRTTGTLQPTPVGASLPEPTGRDSEPPGSGAASADAAPPASPVSKQPRSEPPPPAECSHCGNCGACLAVTRSPSRDARLCVRRSAYSDGTGSQSGPSADHKSGKVASGLAWGDYTSTLRPKDMVPIPWMVAMALQADGWYLRSDVIWAKPNPMPESVTDRPTKSHEYVFLLTKSPRYYFDADAVREPLGTAPNAQSRGPKDTPDRGPRDGGNGGRHATALRMRDGSHGGRNIRTVWNIATQPYPGAHFATFPEKLVEPCILAGCPTEGTVLDPFGGSGTTARVANRLGRRAVLIDLNPEYLTQQMKRAVEGVGMPLGLDVA